MGLTLKVKFRKSTRKSTMYPNMNMQQYPNFLLFISLLVLKEIIQWDYTDKSGKEDFNTLKTKILHTLLASVDFFSCIDLHYTYEQLKYIINSVDISTIKVNEKLSNANTKLKNNRVFCGA